MRLSRETIYPGAGLGFVSRGGGGRVMRVRGTPREAATEELNFRCSEGVYGGFWPQNQNS